MLQFSALSFWEKQAVSEGIDFVVIGGGIVGIACAIEIRKQVPDAKIVLLERGYLSTGASTKNAGFACFGSVTEILDDLSRMNETAVWDTVALRYEGLQRLQERFDPKEIDLTISGSWDLIPETDTHLLPEYSGKLGYLNEQVARITGKDHCYRYDTSLSSQTGFHGINGGYFNRLEGEINTGKLLLASNRLLAQHNIICLYGITVNSLENSSSGVTIQTNYGELRCRKTAVTVNGFAQELLQDHRIQPARAQVIVTSEMDELHLPGTYHFQQGYYYFRSVGKRILLGGGRNLDMKGETTTSFEQTDQIIHSLTHLLSETIIPGKPFTIDYQWSGIMGIGDEKKPIIESKGNIGIGVRMGGMGVAIGSTVGEQLARLIT